jgi:hypothetical protein
VLFAGCGGLQLPIGAPKADVPNSRANGISHRLTSSSYQVPYRFKGQANGETPLGGLVDVKGTLYGTTEGGGTPHCHRFQTGARREQSDGRFDRRERQAVWYDTARRDG